MKILINTATTFKGGSIQVADSFINECKKISHNEYFVILSKRLQERIRKEEFPDNFHFFDAPFKPASRVFSLKAADSFHKKIEKDYKPDVVFTTSGPSYWRPKVPHLMGYNLGHYVYPESIVFDLMSFPKRLRWKLKGITILYYINRDGDNYVVQTDDVNQRLSKTLKTTKEIFTVSNTCSEYYFNPSLYPPKLPKKKDGEFRMLTLSAYYLHKNLEIIKSLVPILKSKKGDTIKFVTTLPSGVFENLFTKQEQQLIYNVGPVPMSECPSLYQECDAKFLPTLLECFSASYPEAMAMKKPILTSDLGFARTVCGDAAIYFNPNDAEEIAEKIITLQQDNQLQKQLIEKGITQLKVFDTPEERAKKYLKICEGLIQNKIKSERKKNSYSKSGD